MTNFLRLSCGLALIGAARANRPFRLWARAKLEDGKPEQSEGCQADLFEHSEKLQTGQYQELGFCVLSSALPMDFAAKIFESFESEIPTWAADCGLDLGSYLQVVNKWSHWNPRVAEMTEKIAPFLRPQVTRVLQSEAWPVGATVFRKSEQAPRGTHAHQDLSYAWRPGSQLFSCTTWVSLTPAKASPLEVLPASHKGGIEAAVDFLDPNFQDRAQLPTWKDEAVTLDVNPGDAVLFDSRLWHSAAPCGSGLRVALAIIWATPAGPDGVIAGEYPRWPMSALPPPPLRPKDGFGMDTVGSQLKTALRSLLRQPALNDSASKLIYAVLASPEETLGSLPDPKLAQRLLLKFLDMRKAVLRHGAAGQNGGLFEALYQAVILPAKRLEWLEASSSRSATSEMDNLKAWMKSWAERTASVLGVVLFGSQASGEAGRWSDLDVCVLSAHGEASTLLTTLANVLEVEWLKGEGVCFTVSNDKLTAMIPVAADGPSLVRLDCFVVDSFSEVSRYLVSSLLDPLLREKAILFARDKKGVLQQLERCLVPPKLQSVVHQVVATFLGSFETAACKMMKGDEYQVFFHLFILYDCLVKLQYIRDGGRRFLYLPKQVFETFSDRLRQKMMHTLAPSVLAEGTWTFGAESGNTSKCPLLLAAYLHEFHEFALAAERDPELACAIQCAMGPLQLPRCTETMRRVLQRAGALKIHGQIYCCASQAGNMDVAAECHVKSVIDLHDHCDTCLLMPDMKCVTVPLPSHPSSETTEASSVFGQFLRALLVLELPVLVRCEDGRKTGAIAALLRFLTDEAETNAATATTWMQCWDILDAMGMLHLLPCYDHLRNRAHAEQVNSKSLRVALALGCGLTCDEIARLYQKLGGKMPAMPQIEFNLVPGQPDKPCRPFTQTEIGLVCQHLLKPSNLSAEAPTGVFVTGLPGSGKSACLAQVLMDLGLELDDMVNLDVDNICLFHSQYQKHAQRVSWTSLQAPKDVIHLESFQGLPTWFHSGAQAEELLYKGANSVLAKLMQRRCHFVLPGIFDQPGTLEFMRFVIKEGYKVHLVGMDVTPDTAQQRAKLRAKKLGRMSCNWSDDVGWLCWGV